METQKDLHITNEDTYLQVQKNVQRLFCSHLVSQGEIAEHASLIDVKYMQTCEENKKKNKI